MPVDGRDGREDDVANEQCLLGRVRAGDERAFAALVEQHSPWMLRTARGLCPAGRWRRRLCRMRGSA